MKITKTANLTKEEAWNNFNKVNWDHHMRISKPCYAEVLNNYPRTSTKKAMDDYSVKHVVIQNLMATKPEEGEELGNWQWQLEGAAITDELMRNDFKEKLIDSLPDKEVQNNLVRGIKGCYDNYPRLAPYVVPGARVVEKEKLEKGSCEYEGRVYSYVVRKGAAGITGVSDAVGKIVIPCELNGLPVRYVEAHAFEKDDKLTGIVFPEGLSYIDTDAFNGCRGLESLRIPSSVEAVGYSAFSGCRGLKSLEICRGVREIGIGAFYHCVSLETVFIPSSVVKIRPGAFAYCSSLKEIVVDSENERYLSIDGVLYRRDMIRLKSVPAGKSEVIISPETEEIGWWSFAGCAKIKSITVPDGVREIGDHAFFDCFALESVEIPKSVVSVGESAFSDCHSLKDTVILPEGLTRLGDSAFWHCTGLTHMDIPDGISVLEDSIFELCTGLREISFPKALTKIGKSAFVFCSALKELVIPEGVTSVGKAAFEFCAGLERITLPSSLSEIKIRAFADCSSLKEFIVAESNGHFASDGGVLTSRDGKTLIAYPCAAVKSAVTVKEGIEALGDACFKGNENLREITLPSSVKSIGVSAFWRCKNLERVNLGEGLELLGNDAFMDAVKLKELHLPESLRTISDWCFWNCSGLERLYIPKSVDGIGLGAFLHCDSLTAIEVAEDNESFTSYDGVLYTKDGSELICCPDGKCSAVLHPETRLIRRYGLLGCKKLERVELNEGLEQIDDWAFDGCESLDKIDMPNTVREIGDYVFEDCFKLKRN